MTLAIRPGRARLGAAGLAAALAAAGLLSFGAGHARAATTTLCAEQTAPVGGSFIVQNNEYDSSASECVSTDGNADFTVANSGISNATNGSPGAYPSIYQGCHWGNCSAGGLTAAPIQVSALTAGKVTTSWSTTQTGSGAYDVAYDIWYNQTPTTTGQPNGTEMMVWLNHNGSVQPFGSEVASNVTIGGHSYNIWYGTQSVWDTVSYEMTSGTTSVSNLDIGALTQDMVSRGYTKSSWYLIDVEAGFELWQGGAGLASNSFAVNIAGGATSSPTPTPTPTGPASPTPTPTPTPTATSPGPAQCSAAYSVVSSWPGGFQGQVVVHNTGPAALNGWNLAWTFPGNQQITSLWNGSYTQTAAAVAVRSASYDSSIPAGGTATVGFTASYAGSNSSPAGVSCS
jgi:glycosyl hydrolase family 12/cellulose binding protein with CBM2 domain